MYVFRKVQICIVRIFFFKLVTYLVSNDKAKRDIFSNFYGLLRIYELQAQMKFALQPHDKS